MTDQLENAVHESEAVSESSELETLKSDMILRYGEIAKLQGEILNCEKYLQLELKKRRAVEVKLKDVHASTSWRVTKPLRKVANMVRRFL